MKKKHVSEKQFRISVKDELLITESETKQRKLLINRKISKEIVRSFDEFLHYTHILCTVLR